MNVTPTQEVTQADDQQPLVQQCTQASEVVDESTVGTDPAVEKSAKAEPKPAIADKPDDASIEVLQERLKLVEQRFAGRISCLAYLLLA